MVLSLVTIPSPLLRTPTRSLDRTAIKSKEVQTLIDNMLDTMPAAHGIGLAAPQVGSDYRIAVVAHERKPYIIINPTLVKRSSSLEDSEEGCLSIPGVAGIVSRHAEVRVAALDRTGARINIRASGLQAFVFQHEIDHLDGILFVDRVTKFLTAVTHDQQKAFDAYRVIHKKPKERS